MTLVQFLKISGKLVIDVYRKYSLFDMAIWFWPKYIFRIITKRMNPETLYNYIYKYINLLWPVSRIIQKLPFGRTINSMLLIPNYKGLFVLDDKKLREWAVLDSFDMLSPKYDSPQKIEDVKQWFKNARMKDIDVHYGYNGIEGRGTRAE